MHRKVFRIVLLFLKIRVCTSKLDACAKVVNGGKPLYAMRGERLNKNCRGKEVMPDSQFHLLRGQFMLKGCLWPKSVVSRHCSIFRNRFQIRRVFLMQGQVGIHQKRIALANEVPFSELSNLILCPLLQLVKLLG